MINTLKNNLKLLILIVILGIIGGGTYYFKFILSPQLETVQSLREQNIAKEQEVQFLEDELKMLPHRKNELKDMQMKVKALSDKIPSYQISAMMMMEIIQYMDIYNFADIEVTMGQALQYENETEAYYAMPITISYISSYSNTIQLIEEIQRSYQMIRVDHLSIDNGIQEEKEPPVVLENDTVETTIVLLLYYTDKEETQSPNFIEFFNKEKNVFLRPGVDEKKSNKTFNASPSSLQSRENSTFNIHIADIFHSGDNYSFSGYNSNREPVYVGLTSSVDTQITLTLRDQGYSCTIEDGEGKKSEKSVTTKIQDPQITITSQMQKVMTNMPTVKIYVHNYMTDVADIRMRGTGLENIVIYNENNEKVPSGRQVGKVSLTI